METKLYIVRHGETDWNRKGLLQGQLESDLTAEAMDDARSMSSVIKDLEPDVVYSSHQRRALKTAELLTKDLDIEIRLHRGLSEMNFGIFQGHDWDYIEREMSHIHKAYRNSGPDYVIPEGESHRAFHKRVTSALDEICFANGGKKILIVSHGGSISKMISYSKGMEPSPNRFFKTRNLALNIFRYCNDQYFLETPAELLEFSPD